MLASIVLTISAVTATPNVAAIYPKKTATGFLLVLISILVWFSVEEKHEFWI